jgi:hypothetical protein
MDNFDLTKYLANNKLTQPINKMEDEYVVFIQGIKGTSEEGAPKEMFRGPEAKAKVAQSNISYRYRDNDVRVGMLPAAKFDSLSEGDGPVSKTRKVARTLGSGASAGEAPATRYGIVGNVTVDGKQYKVKASAGKHTPIYTVLGLEGFSPGLGMKWDWFLDKLENLYPGAKFVETPEDGFDSLDEMEGDGDNYYENFSYDALKTVYDNFKDTEDDMDAETLEEFGRLKMAMNGKK